MTVDYNCSINACYTEILVNRLGLSWMITGLCWLWGVKPILTMSPYPAGAGNGNIVKIPSHKKQKWNMKLRICK
jgi:hypothetical protein